MDKYAHRVTASALGTLALWAAIFAGLVAIVPGTRTRVRRASLILAATLAGISTAILLVALLANDFSLAYVAETSSRATPWPYRLAALWGGMDGSMLFYSTLTLIVSAFALTQRAAIAVAGLIGSGYLGVTALFANPFSRLDMPAVDGRGLLAILQHPAMVYHPPILYLGLTMLVVPFAITVHAVMTRRLDKAWLTEVRRWLLGAWTLLTVGMVAGASWAYVELGWGGFWAWDPVENTALMPWLGVTVFIHTSRVQQRDGRLRRWNVLFAMLPFALTILGVYLTRSGVTGSIHSFAESPVIGVTLLSAALLALGVSFAFAIKAPHGEPWEKAGPGRDIWLVCSAGLLCAALVFVTVGTAYPAYASVFFSEAVTIDSRFFAMTTYPIAIAIGILSIPALDTSWSRANLDVRLVVAWLVAGTVASVAIGAVFGSEPTALALTATGFAGVATLLWRMAWKRPRGRVLVSHVAHLGFVMLLVGVGGSALGGDFRGTMSPGESIEVSGRDVVLASVVTGEADRYIFVRASFIVDGKDTAKPEIRAYEDQTQPVSEPALVSNPGADVIVAVSQLAPDAETVSVSVFVRPLVWWVWAGALTMLLAGLAGLFWTAGDVSARRRSARGEQQSEGTTSGIAAR